jgi:hypothetical protein
VVADILRAARAPATREQGAKGPVQRRGADAPRGGPLREVDAGLELVVSEALEGVAVAAVASVADELACFYQRWGVEEDGWEEGCGTHSVWGVVSVRSLQRIGKLRGRRIEY